MNRIPAGDEHTITPSLCVAFSGTMRVASGKIDHVAAKSKQLMDREPSATVLVFDSSTAHQVEIDFRGSVSDVRNRAKRQALTESGTTSQDDPSLKPQTSRGPGRPKLGVIAREVTLLPRHWAWLKSQPGGASVTLRKLVEKGEEQVPAKTTAGKHRTRPTALPPSWREIYQASKKQPAPFSQDHGKSSNLKPSRGPRTFASNLSGSETPPSDSWEGPSN